MSDPREGVESAAQALHQWIAVPCDCHRGQALDSLNALVAAATPPSRLEQCPVCSGVGNVSPGFYSRTGDTPMWASADLTPETCRTCGGKGIVWRGERPEAALGGLSRGPAGRRSRDDG